jgi:hypothetical protein
VSSSPRVRRRRCSQVGRDVLRQDAAVLRYASRVIRTMRAQKSAPFSSMARDVLTYLWRHMCWLVRSLIIWKYIASSAIMTLLSV